MSQPSPPAMQTQMSASCSQRAMNEKGHQNEAVEAFMAKVSALAARWNIPLQQMEAYEIVFARRLAECMNQKDAEALCRQWAVHRIDSIRGVQGQLLDLWQDSISTIPISSDESPATIESARHGG